MLSRVADNLYWMSRYIERAENVARLLEVNLNLLLDFAEFDDGQAKEHWEPIIRALGGIELFGEMYDKATNETVTDFLTFNRRNNGSILSAIGRARENARMVRDQISSEMWETLNRLYLFVESANARKVWKQGPHDFFNEVKNTTHLFSGLTDATFSHDEGFNFLQLGKYLERADKTTRILDLKYHILLPSPADVGGAVDAVQWTAVLRSCSALEAYHRLHMADVKPWKIAEFLMLSDSFPRSIRFCLKMFDRYLRYVSGSSAGYFSNRAEQLCGRLLSDLNFSTIDDIFATGLHEYLEDVQRRLLEIGQALFEAYMFLRPVEDSDEGFAQQQQQQQQ